MNVHKPLRYFNSIMILVYLGAGVALLLPVHQVSYLKSSTRIILGIALILYGIFRAWRTMKINKDE
jgi:hypothetical protein